MNELKGGEILSLLPPQQYEKEQQHEEVVCSHCGRKNRLPIGRNIINIKCGHRKRPLRHSDAAAA